MSQWDEIAFIESDGSNTQLVAAGLSQDYDDLHVIFEGFVNVSGTVSNGVVVRLNGDSSAANYATEVMMLDGGSALFEGKITNAVNGWTVYRLPAVISGNTGNWGYMSFDIIAYKQAVQRNCVAQHCTIQQANGSAMGAMGMTYKGTSAITSVGVYAPSIAFGNKSTLTVYGLKNS